MPRQLTDSADVVLKSQVKPGEIPESQKNKKVFWEDFGNLKSRYLRDYLELEKNKNISPHLLVESCSFPGSFETVGAIWGDQK